MTDFNIFPEDLTRVILQHNEWGLVKVPDSFKTGLNWEQERDLKIILEDRRVTDLSAHYWMKLVREDLAELRADKARLTVELSEARELLALIELAVEKV